jgi:2-hydroxychromene-2-carboxylate isomerase
LLPVFRFDTNSPYAYLASLRVETVLEMEVEWRPIAFAFVLRAQQRTPWSLREATRVAGVAECEGRAATRGLPRLTWPPGWPVDSYTLEPLRAITAAVLYRRERELARAAFRRNFVTGEGLRSSDVVRACWEEAGLDPATYDDDVKAAQPRLVEATERAIEEGVPGVPTLTVAGAHFWGDDRIEEAARALTSA